MIIDMLTGFYILCALLLALHTAGQGVLLVRHLWRTRAHPTPPAPAEWPIVTIQLPIYNERHVVQRLLEAATALDYPADRLHIQVLDDSTDETSLIVSECIARLGNRGVHISHVRRVDRSGYKAGALAYGLEQASGECIAIFDADFLPPADFLRRTVPYLLADTRRGLVQTRWGHLNADANWLTQAQRLAIDAHFVIEQSGRQAGEWLLPFNGTGGLWRVACIRSAGGWSSATLTEDFDLSYRAQLAGWRACYLPDVIVPGELPPQLAAYRRQQARWAMGSTQCLRRLLGPVWRAKHLTLTARLLATQHLSQYLPQFWMICLLVLTPPLALADALGRIPLAPLGLMGLIPPLMLVLGQQQQGATWRRLLALPVLIALATGTTWYTSRAVLAGLLGRPARFDRTPKFNGDWSASGYALAGGWPLAETLLGLYALWGAILAWQAEPAIVPYVLWYALSFGVCVVWQLRDRWRLRPLARRYWRAPSLS